MKKVQTKRNRGSMHVGGDASNDSVRTPRCFLSPADAAEFIRERALKRILWNLEPKFKSNYLQILCSKKSCATKSCNPRGALVDAQNIVNKAFSEENIDMKVRLARAALKFDERCVDAHLILGLFDFNRSISREQRFADAIDAGLQVMRQTSAAPGRTQDVRAVFSEPRARPYVRALSVYTVHRKARKSCADDVIWSKLLQIEPESYWQLLAMM